MAVMPLDISAPASGDPARDAYESRDWPVNQRAAAVDGRVVGFGCRTSGGAAGYFGEEDKGGTSP
jgi:hypothetical protein